MKRALILANGTPPDRRLLYRHLRAADVFICADGGANTAARFKIEPQLIIGDFDSVCKKTLVQFKNAEIKYSGDQNSTDLEKALTAALNMKYDNIIVLGATGGRFDHAVGNLSALAKFSRYAAVSFIDNRSMLMAVGKETKIRIRPGTTVSLIPLSRCSGIVTSGLKWNLRNESLGLGLRESTSNVVKSSHVTIAVRRGILILFILRTKINQNPLYSHRGTPAW
jgi:thiamine pyrophosphokinase